MLSVKKIEKIARLKARARYHDRDGLYLRVHETGAMSWLFRFSMAGKERWMGLGDFPTFNLDEARERARFARQQVKDDIDPIEARRQKRAAEAPAPAPTAMSFKEAAQSYFKLNEKKWKNLKSRAQFLSSLEAYAFPTIGRLPVTAIDARLVLDCIEPHWGTKTETMSRVRGRIETVLGWAMVRGHRQPGDNPARWSKHLASVLPARSQVTKVKHFAALPYAELSAFSADLAQRAGTAARALEFTVLTAARTGETIGARWSEIDLDAKIWTIPAERMKARKEHRVPLSAPALAVLNAVHRESDNPFVFPGTRYGEGLSNMAMATVLRRMGRGDVTVHGFRSAFRDWAGETTSFPNHVVEMALAHTIGDAVEKAYRRGDLLAKRKALMDAWARYCTTPVKAGVVVPMRKAQ